MWTGKTHADVCCRRCSPDIISVAERPWDSGAQQGVQGQLVCLGPEGHTLPWAQVPQESLAPVASVSHTLEEGSLPTFSFLATFPFLAESSALHVGGFMGNQKCPGPIGQGSYHLGRASHFKVRLFAALPDRCWF